jgi:hypothetical protein
VGTYVVTGLYAVAAVYYDNRCFADRLAQGGGGGRSLLSRTLDNSAWHFLATVTLTPLVVIPAVKVGAKRLLAGRASLSPAMREKVLPATLAILAIPAVVSPVDNATTFAFNQFRATPEPYHWSGFWGFMQEEHHAPPEKKLS